MFTYSELTAIEGAVGSDPSISPDLTESILGKIAPVLDAAMQALAASTELRCQVCRSGSAGTCTGDQHEWSPALVQIVTGEPADLGTCQCENSAHFDGAAMRDEGWHAYGAVPASVADTPTHSSCDACHANHRQIPTA